MLSHSETAQNVVSAICVGFENTPEINAQAFGVGFLLPVVSFFIGMGISSIFGLLKGL